MYSSFYFRSLIQFGNTPAVSVLLSNVLDSMYSILSNLIQRKTMVGVCPKSFAPGNEKLRDPEVPLPRSLLFYPRKTKAKKTSRKEKEKTNKKGGDFKSEGHFVREQVGSSSERVVKLPEHWYAFVPLKRIKSLRLSRAIFRSKPSKNLPLT